MTIEESLNNLIELQKDYQQFHNNVWQDPESYGIIAESLRIGIETMRKYQKIEQIVSDRYGKPTFKFMDAIIKVLEDGND